MSELSKLSELSRLSESNELSESSESSELGAWGESSESSKSDESSDHVKNDSPTQSWPQLTPPPINRTAPTRSETDLQTSAPQVVAWRANTQRNKSTVKTKTTPRPASLRSPR